MRTSCCTCRETLKLCWHAPLLCAGITTYAPLRHAKIRAGQKVYCGPGRTRPHGRETRTAAFGANVVVFTTSANKTADAIPRLGAREVVEFQKRRRNAETCAEKLVSFHPRHGSRPTQYQSLHQPAEARWNAGAGQALRQSRCPLTYSGALFARRNISGSIIGGIRETQEMLDFCGQHNVTADIEMIGMQQINQAYDRLQKNDVKYRFVIDIASLR